MQIHSLRAAWTQGIVFAVITVGATAAGYGYLHRPFDSATLAIPVGELQAQATEGAALVQLHRAHQVSPAFVARHAAQLAGNVERVGDALRAKPARADLAGVRIRAMQLQAALDEGMRALASAGRSDAPDAGFESLAAQFKQLHQQIEAGS